MDEEAVAEAEDEQEEIVFTSSRRCVVLILLQQYYLHHHPHGALAQSSQLHLTALLLPPSLPPLVSNTRIPFFFRFWHIVNVSFFISSFWPLLPSNTDPLLFLELYDDARSHASHSPPRGYRCVLDTGGVESNDSASHELANPVTVTL